MPEKLANFLPLKGRFSISARALNQSLEEGLDIHEHLERVREAQEGRAAQFFGGGGEILTVGEFKTPPPAPIVCVL